jgi:sugar lactone lactonase YvrE
MAGVARRNVLALVCLAMLAAPTAASAYRAAPGYQAGDYATSFPTATCCAWGPIGVAFDASDNLYVASNADGHIYRFQPGGGAASPDTRLTGTPIPGDIKGLAIGRDGRVYLARYDAGDVVEVDPATGGVLRTVATGIRCALGLAVDPISGDLFASQGSCGMAIWRVSGFAEGGEGSARPYSGPLPDVDGLTFAPDGTLYAASAGHVVKIDGTDKPTAGASRSVTAVPHADGVAIGLAAAGDEPFLVANGTDGNVTRVDFSKSPAEKTPVLTEGTRGDFVAVDSRGCLYVTQTSTVVRITPTGRACDLAPSTPGGGGLPAGIDIDVITPRGTTCKRLKKVVLRVRQRGRVRLRYIKVYIGPKKVKTLRKKRVTARIVLTKRLPRKSFTVKAVGKTTSGKKVKKRVRFRNC